MTSGINEANRYERPLYSRGNPNDRLTDADIEAALKACEAVPAAPWETREGYGLRIVSRVVCSIFRSPSNGKVIGSNDLCKVNTDFGVEKTEAVTSFIALARTALPAALADLQALRAAVAKLEGEWRKEADAIDREPAMSDRSEMYQRGQALGRRYAADALKQLLEKP